MAAVKAGSWSWWIFFFFKYPLSFLGWVPRSWGPRVLLDLFAIPPLLRSSLLFSIQLRCCAGRATTQPLCEWGPGDCCICWVLALLLPTPSWKQWARWLSFLCLGPSHRSIQTVRPVTVAVFGSGGKAWNIRFVFIREASSDSSCNGQQLCTEWGCACYTICVNHEVGNRGIPGTTKFQLLQLESCSGLSFWSMCWKAGMPSA